MKKKQLVIVSGMSGSGKTLVVHTFEDLGFFCIDNLPPELLSNVTTLWDSKDCEKRDVALVVDARAGCLFDGFLEAYEKLSQTQLEGFEKPRILFLDADDEVLVRRFKETRRKHPVFGKGRDMIESIGYERKMLAEIKARADKILDTSNLEPAGLRREVVKYFGRGRESSQLIVTVESFGFKFGIPLDADLVFDVRFLANPHYVPSLQQLNGNSKEVANFVFEDPLTKPLIEKLSSLLEFSIPQYIKEGKAYLTIAIGCTGGRHRSVVIANELGKLLSEKGVEVIIKHRDIDEPRSRITERPPDQD